MFKDFLSFLVLIDQPINQVNTTTLLSFMEFMVQSNFSHANIANHVSGLRASYILHGLSTDIFKDERIPLFLKSLQINAPFSPTVRVTISVDMLMDIIRVCDKLRHPVLFKALYVFCFFSFLRLSNILPHAIRQYDVTRHLARGDVIITSDKCSVIIKWSKTNQKRKDYHTISLPCLGKSPICPLAAMTRMYKAYPASKNDPLFLVWSANRLQTLTDSVARKHLKKVCLLLDIKPSLTFHSFRRSGTTWAFHKGVPLEHIMSHGLWSSEAVWRYIQSQPSSSSRVSAAFQHHLQL